MRLKYFLIVVGVSLPIAVVGIIIAVRHFPRASAPTVAAPQDAAVTVHAEGRVTTRPGMQAKLGAELQGRVTAVHVVEGQAVKKGELLAQLDAREYYAALQEAVGSSKEARARARARKADMARSKKLVTSGALPTREADHAREEKTAADGRLTASDGAAQRARVLIAKTRIVAPIDGVVISRTVDPAETVAPGAPLFVIADLDGRWVEAEVDEFDIGRIVLGGHALVRADGFPDQSWEGHVEEIPAAVQPRRLRPQDPSRPTDSAVLLVKVSLPSDSPLKLGQRVNVTFTFGSPATTPDAASLAESVILP